MADVADPGACETCGHPLPNQQGRGRRRRYCSERCRDAARRDRVRQGVKELLTAEDDPVTARVAQAVRSFIENQGSVNAAHELSAAADEALQAAVDRARAAGQSWREIGEELGTSRQAAFQRFGHPVDPRTGVAMSREVPVGAEQRAAVIFAWHNEGRWDDIVAELDDAMRARLDSGRLSDGWARMAGMFGQLERIGEPSARRVADDAIVDVPLFFEAGDARGLVRFGPDGKIAGLAIRPPSTGA
jgi:hypothetical protein